MNILLIFNNKLTKLIKKTNILLKKIAESKFSKDTIWLIGSQGILLISGLVINLLIGEKLGASDLGVFNQVLGYYTIFSTIFSLGLNNSIIKKIASINNLTDIHQDDVVFSSNFFLTAILSILFSVIFLLFALNFPHFFSSKEVADAIIIPFLSMPLYNLNKNFMAYYTGKRMQKEFSMVRSLRWILIILFIFIALILKQKLKVLLFAFLFSEGILFLFSFFRLIKLFTIKFNKPLLIDNFKFGFKTFSAEIFAVFNDKFDLLIIGYFLTNVEVGVYSFFIFFVKALYIFPGILQQNLNPLISKYWSENTINLLEIKMKKILKVNLIVLIVQSLITVTAYFILITYFKHDFSATTHLLIIALIGVFPSALISWSGSLLVMTNKLKENLYRTFIIMIISIITTFAFTYYFGLVGAAFSVSISSLISCLLMYTIIKKVLGIRII
jgi:stage V sporulation protein B